MALLRYAIALLLVVAIPAAICYWLLIHPFARFWRRHGPRTAYLAVLPVITAIMAGMFLLRDRLLARDLGFLESGEHQVPGRDGGRRRTCRGFLRGQRVEAHEFALLARDRGDLNARRGRRDSGAFDPRRGRGTTHTRGLALRHGEHEHRDHRRGQRRRRGERPAQPRSRFLPARARDLPPDRLPFLRGKPNRVPIEDVFHVSCPPHSRSARGCSLPPRAVRMRSRARVWCTRAVLSAQPRSRAISPKLSSSHSRSRSAARC